MTKTILMLILFVLALSPLSAMAKPKHQVGYKQSGKTSYYAKRFHNRKTASGERYNHYAMTAAHRTLPFGTRVLVTRKDTKESIVVRINDRGPYHGKRILDLSGKAATKLDLRRVGVADVSIKILSIPKV